jgi:hypothetical protein
MVNLGWTHPAAKVVFKDARDEVSVESNESEDAVGSGLEVDTGPVKWKHAEDEKYVEVLSSYPILRDLMKEVKKSCHCSFCRVETPSVPVGLPDGCLRRTSFLEVMCLIAHGIVDAFGADDVSAISNKHLNDMGVAQILISARDGDIKWNEWFDTASRTYLGCPPISTTESEIQNLVVKRGLSKYTNSFFSTVVAVQYGGSAVIVPWLDLTRPLTVIKSFAFTTAKGKLGITRQDESNQVQFQAVEGDFSVIETQGTEDTEAFVQRFSKPTTDTIPKARIEPDTVPTNIDYVLVPFGSMRYKLLTRVASLSHSRLIDPCAAMRKMLQPLMMISCNHPPHQGSVPTLYTQGTVLFLYSFDEILARWGAIQKTRLSRSGDESPIRAFHVTHVLDTNLKLNIALALSVDDVVIINQEAACFACAIRQAHNTGTVNGLDSTYHDRWIINTEKMDSQRSRGLYLENRQAKQE